MSVRLVGFAERTLGNRTSFARVRRASARSSRLLPVRARSSVPPWLPAPSRHRLPNSAPPARRCRTLRARTAPRRPLRRERPRTPRPRRRAPWSRRARGVPSSTHALDPRNRFASADSSFPLRHSPVAVESLRGKKEQISCPRRVSGNGRPRVRSAPRAGRSREGLRTLFRSEAMRFVV